MKNDNSIEQLIYLMSKLPGLGPRSARRIVIYLLQDKEIRLQGLIQALTLLDNTIVKCSVCYNIDTQDPCNICASSKRDNSIIAVVESVTELWALERSKVFHGFYHVLEFNSSGLLQPNHKSLKLDFLMNRCNNMKVKEIIIATNSTIEGQTTAYYITEYFKNSGIKISRPASGIPIGGELDYLDEGTLSAALSLRQPFE